MSESTDRYCGPAPATRTAANGAVAAAELIRDRRSAGGPETRSPDRPEARSPGGPRIITVAPGVHTYVGGSIVNRTFIEGEDGVIVYDTGVDLADGRRALAALRSVTDKPVACVIYSHNHYAHGTQAFLGDSAEVPVIGHPRVNGNLARGGDAMDFPEAAPALALRFRFQFASFLPETGPDAPVGATYPSATPAGTVPVSVPVEDGREMTVAGVRMQFLTEHWTDSDDTLTVWLPDLGVALNNFLWPTIPNFYSLRGTGFRDPRSWRDGVLQLRDLQPEHLISTHARPVSGRECVRETLEGYADAIAHTYDQSIRGILHGLGPDELRSFVRLPEHLASQAHNRDGYGETQYQPPYVYERVLGWYDGRPEHINPPPRELAGTRIVEGFGGPARVREAVAEALERGEASWAAALAGHLLDADPGSRAHRELKAATLRALAQRAGGTIARHFYLTHARQLEGTAVIPPSEPWTVADVLRAPPRMHIDHLRVRLDPERSGETERFLALTLTDRDTRAGLHLRRSVCEYVADVDRHPYAPDAELELDAHTWALLLTGGLSWADAIAKGAVRVRGEAADVVEFFGFFDPQPGPSAAEADAAEAEVGNA
ncbi:alkyl sulfatase dimerization domain-containing protein [Brevibacterium album]|uniref:alkyl sulfatase dimerization domain-containing protein n=1 Tax=Brevibacterium album TaxID=417948 RepID=UPI0003F73D65|nr:alkyl sulfatase dimerization domain-containing protein [Brevibacterium album]